MAGFQAVAGALPNGYADILNAYQPTPALNDKVRVISVNPDGTPVSLGSIAAMYGNAYSDNGAHGSTALAPEGLTSRSVHTVPIDNLTGNPINAGDSIIDRPAITASGRVSPVNAATPLDIGPLGLTNNPFRPQTSAQQAITAALGGGSGFGGTGLNGHSSLAGMFSGDPGTTDWSVANPGDGGLYGVPAQGRYAGNNSGTPPMRRAAPAPVAPPPTPVQSLASMFTPAAQPPLMSGDLYGANRGFGGENAQMPDSMNNSRWRDGY